MAAHDRSQTNRYSLSIHDSGLLHCRQRRRCVDAHRAPVSDRRPHDIGDLQQAIHDSWDADGLVFFDPIDPCSARKFCIADDDRRTGRRLSEIEPDELVSFCPRRRVRDLVVNSRRRRYWLDVLHALQHDLRKLARDLDGGRCFRGRFFHHRDRDQFHRHYAQDARAGFDLVPVAAVRLVALRDEPDHGARDASARDHASFDFSRTNLGRGNL